MNTYQALALESASPVELTIALYDGIVRFMNEAIEAVERNDAERRREGWKAVLAEINANDVAENGPVAAGAGYDVTSNLRPGGGASWTV